MNMRWLSAVQTALLVMCCCPALARAQSAVDGFDPGANNSVRTVVVQADGKVLVGGEFTMLGGGTATTPRNYIGRLNADGSVDANFNPGANGTVWSLALQPDGKILVGGDFTGLGGVTGTTTRNHLGRLNTDGSVDTLFDPGTSGLSGTVYTMAVQPDGKIVVGGIFSGIGGGTGTTPRSSLARINADGTVDTFNPGVKRRGQSVEQIYASAVQPDGKILVAGFFIGLGGGTGETPRSNIGRLNSDGSVDSFDPGVNHFVLTLVLQVDGKIVIGGTFFMMGGGGNGTTARNGIGRINADGSLDTSFDPGTNAVNALAVQPDGKILVGGRFVFLGSGGTAPRSKIGRLNADGSLDLTFDPGANGDGNEGVFALAIQPDGKVVVGGSFTMLGGGGSGTTARHKIGRLYADGSLDGNFNPGTDGHVYALALQPDGRIMVGGGFTMMAGWYLSNLGRLRADGFPGGLVSPNAPVNAIAPQPDGKAVVGGAFTEWYDGVWENSLSRNNIGRLNEYGYTDFDFDPGANGPVNAVAPQADGKIVVGGSYSILSGAEELNLGRLNPDGSIDGTFAVWTNGTVLSIVMQPDGKILVGGAFTTLYDDNTGTQLPRNRIGRINADGSLDATFNPGADGSVNVLAVQRDGKILVGGAFSMLGGQKEANLGRLNADGSVDASFALWTNEQVWALALHADGKILVGGAFTTITDYNNSAVVHMRQRIARLNPAGSVDTSFDPGANNYVYALAVQQDGKVLVAGAFSALGAGATTPRSHVGRLSNTEAAIQHLRVTIGGSRVSWLRSGAAPEVWRVTFESSNDGVTYTSLGAGTRVANGWQLSGQSLPTNQNLYIRARGYFATGLRNGSASIVESIVRTVAKASVPFTDDVLTAGTTMIRAVHVTELRARIDALRIHFGLAAYPYPAAPLTAFTTIAQGTHIDDLRTALSQAYAAAGLQIDGFTDSSLFLQKTFIKAVHVDELRNAVLDLEQR
jgi:uncharacterized delta-60 repeat protein